MMVISQSRTSGGHLVSRDGPRGGEPISETIGRADRSERRKFRSGVRRREGVGRTGCRVGPTEEILPSIDRIPKGGHATPLPGPGLTTYGSEDRRSLRETSG